MLFLYLTLWSSTNTFSVENKSKASFTYDIVLKNYKNTTKTNGYLVYKITSNNGYNMAEYKDMPKDGENGENVIRVRKVNYKNAPYHMTQTILPIGQIQHYILH